MGCYSRGGTLRDHYSYWKLQTLPTIPNNCILTSASFNIRLKNGTSSMGSIELYGAGHDWQSNTLKWANRPYMNLYMGKISTVPSGTEKWLTYVHNNLDTTMRGWYDSPDKNYGLLLKYATCVNDYNVLYSSDYRPDGSTAYIPYLTISYEADVPVSQVCLSTTSRTMKTNDTFYLRASVVPFNATFKGIVFSSSDTDIVTIGATSGLVTAKKPGTAVLRATSSTNVDMYASCTVTVILGDFNKHKLGTFATPELLDAQQSDVYKRQILYHLCKGSTL